jgi:hypothetical protein
VAPGKDTLEGKGQRIPIEEVFPHPDADGHKLCWYPQLAEGEITHLVLNALVPIGKRARLGYIFPAVFHRCEMAFLEVELSSKTAPHLKGVKFVKFPMSRVAVAPGQMPPSPFVMVRQKVLSVQSRNGRKYPWC